VATNELFRFTGYRGRTERGRRKEAKTSTEDQESIYARMQESRYFQKSRRFMKGYEEEIKLKQLEAERAKAVTGPKMTLYVHIW